MKPESSKPAGKDLVDQRSEFQRARLPQELEQLCFLLDHQLEQQLQMLPEYPSV